MKNKIMLLTLCAMLFALCTSAHAQQPKKVFRIGYLSSTDRVVDSLRAEGLRAALRELGYIEGQNIATEYRYAEGKPERQPELAAELVRLNVDIIVVLGGTQPIRAAKNATKTIPIVMTGQGLDPIKAGLVESLARPGGNVTGLTILSTELGGKRLELFKEAVPKLARVAVFNDPTTVGATREVKEDLPVAARARADYTNLGGTRCGGIRQGIRWAKQGSPGWTLCAPRGRQASSQCETDHGLCVKEPVTVDVQQ